MAEKVKLSLQVEPELRRRVKLSAAARDESVREWVQRAILRELEAEELEGGEEMILPPTGVKPRGSRSPARPKGGGNPVSEAVVEDRR
jgi:hypothetical protein